MELYHVVGIPHWPKRAKHQNLISKRAEPANHSASVFLPESSNAHLLSQPQSISKTGIRCSAPPRSRRPGNAQFSPATLVSTLMISLGARPAERPLRPVNQVTLAVRQGDAVQDRRESRSSLRASLPTLLLPRWTPRVSAVD